MHTADETEDERLNRELDQLLQELRVAMPGVQVLFAFLLAVPFQQRFAQVTEFQRDVYFVHAAGVRRRLGAVHRADRLSPPDVPRRATSRGSSRSPASSRSPGSPRSRSR